MTGEPSLELYLRCLSGDWSDFARRLFSSASDSTVHSPISSPEAVSREMVFSYALQALNSSSPPLPLSYIASEYPCECIGVCERMGLLWDVAAALEVECHSCHLVLSHPWSKREMQEEICFCVPVF